MNVYDFNNGLDRLHDFYGSKLFNEKQAQMLFQRLKLLSPHEWKQVIEDTFVESPRSPSAAFLMQRATPALVEANRRSKQLKMDEIANSGKECPKCFNSGQVDMVDPKGAPWAHRCDCGIPEKVDLSMKIPSLETGFKRGLKVKRFFSGGPGKHPVTRENIERYLKGEIEEGSLDYSPHGAKELAQKYLKELWADDKREAEGKSGGERVGPVAEKKSWSVGKERAAEQGDS